MAIGVDSRTGEIIHIPDNPLEAGVRGAIEGAAASAPVSAISSVLGGLGHVLGAPARAVAAVGQNLAGTGQRISPLDAAVYGRDMNTGQVPAQYGTLLSKVAFGEDAPRSGVAALTEDVGNIAGDPLVALGVSKLAGTAVAGDVGVKAQERALANLGASKMESGVKRGSGFDIPDHIRNAADPHAALREAMGLPPTPPAGAGGALPKPPTTPPSNIGGAPSSLLDTDLTTGQHAGRHIGVRDFNRQVGQWARKGKEYREWDRAPIDFPPTDAAAQAEALGVTPSITRVPPGSARGDIGYGSYDAAVADLPPDIVGGVAGGQPFRTPRPRGGGNVDRLSDVVAAEGRGPKPSYFPVSEPVAQGATRETSGIRFMGEPLDRDLAFAAGGDKPVIRNAATMMKEGARKAVASGRRKKKKKQ